MLRRSHRTISSAPPCLGCHPFLRVVTIHPLPLPFSSPPASFLFLTLFLRSHVLQSQPLHPECLSAASDPSVVQTALVEVGYSFGTLSRASSSLIENFMPFSRASKGPSRLMHSGSSSRACKVGASSLVRHECIRGRQHRVRLFEGEALLRFLLEEWNVRLEREIYRRILSAMLSLLLLLCSPVETHFFSTHHLPPCHSGATNVVLKKKLWPGRKDPVNRGRFCVVRTGDGDVCGVFEGAFVLHRHLRFQLTPCVNVDRICGGRRKRGGGQISAWSTHRPLVPSAEYARKSVGAVREGMCHPVCFHHQIFCPTDAVCFLQVDLLEVRAEEDLMRIQPALFMQTGDGQWTRNLYYAADRFRFSALKRHVEITAESRRKEAEERELRVRVPYEEVLPFFLLVLSSSHPIFLVLKIWLLPLCTCPGWHAQAIRKVRSCMATSAERWASQPEDRWAIILLDTETASLKRGKILELGFKVSVWLFVHCTRG